MAQSFKETAHLKTDLEKYHSNFDAIDWTIKKKEPEEGEVVFTDPMIEPVDLTNPENAYLWGNGLIKREVISREELEKRYPRKD